MVIQKQFYSMQISIQDFHTKSTIDRVPGASGEPPVDIVSPSDIYKQFVEQPSQPRSILKPARVYPDVDEMTSQVTEVKERVILPGSREVSHFILYLCNHPFAVFYSSFF